MFELNNVEGVDHSHYLNGEGEVLRQNLMKLLKSSDNPYTHDLILEIMTEAGYPWFTKLMRSGKVDCKSAKASLKKGALLDDDDFMSLLPANGYIH